MEDLGKLAIAVSFFILLHSMVAKWLHDKYHIPDPLLMIAYGIAIGKEGLGLLQTQHAFSSAVITYASRILLCLQTMAVSLSLPGHYLRNNIKSVFNLVVLGGFLKCGIIFCVLRVFSSLSTPTCWAIAASLTPTDPILSASIVKGRFARTAVPLHLRTLLAAESGINDGLGIIMLNISVEVLHTYKKLFVADSQAQSDIENDRVSFIVQLLRSYEALIPAAIYQDDSISSYLPPKYVRSVLEYSRTSPSIKSLIFPLWHFFLSTIIKKVIVSAVIGYVIGLITRKVTRTCCAVELMRSEVLIIHTLVLSFLGLALMDHMGGSELICIFFMGTALSEDEWYYLEGSSRKMSEIVESLFSNAFFIFLGSLIKLSQMPPRIILIAAIIVLFTRTISLILISQLLPILGSFKEVLFIGWFGPIGVGALYYCILYDHAMNTLTIDLAMCIVFLSTIIHGISVPLYCVARKIFNILKEPRHAAAS